MKIQKIVIQSVELSPITVVDFDRKSVHRKTIKMSPYAEIRHVNVYARNTTTQLEFIPVIIFETEPDDGPELEDRTFVVAPVGATIESSSSNTELIYCGCINYQSKSFLYLYEDRPRFSLPTAHTGSPRIK